MIKKKNVYIMVINWFLKKLIIKKRNILRQINKVNKLYIQINKISSRLTPRNFSIGQILLNIYQLYQIKINQTKNIKY